MKCVLSCKSFSLNLVIPAARHMSALSLSSAPAPCTPSSTVNVKTLVQCLENARMLAVVTLERVEDAAPLAAALREGGIQAAELALRTPVALDALQALRQAAPDLLLGAGTVLSPQQADEAQKAGADFALAPGLDAATVRHCAQRGFPFIPGVATPSEMQLAIGLGCRVLKFFPAEALGGAAGLRAAAQPFAHLGVRYLPMGGIDAGQAAAYAALPAVAAVGGSWIAPPEDIRHGAWNKIAGRAREAMLIFSNLRA